MINTQIANNVAQSLKNEKSDSKTQKGDEKTSSKESLAQALKKNLGILPSSSELKAPQSADEVSIKLNNLVNKVLDQLFSKSSLNDNLLKQSNKLNFAPNFSNEVKFLMSEMKKSDVFSEILGKLEQILKPANEVKADNFAPLFKSSGVFFEAKLKDALNPDNLPKSFHNLLNAIKSLNSTDIANQIISLATKDLDPKSSLDELKTIIKEQKQQNQEVLKNTNFKTLLNLSSKLENFKNYISKNPNLAQDKIQSLATNILKQIQKLEPSFKQELRKPESLALKDIRFLKELNQAFQNLNQTLKTIINGEKLPTKQETKAQIQNNTQKQEPQNNIKTQDLKEEIKPDSTEKEEAQVAKNQETTKIIKENEKTLLEQDKDIQGQEDEPKSQDLDEKQEIKEENPKTSQKEEQSKTQQENESNKTQPNDIEENQGQNFEENELIKEEPNNTVKNENPKESPKTNTPNVKDNPQLQKEANKIAQEKPNVQANQNPQAEGKISQERLNNPFAEPRLTQNAPQNAAQTQQQQVKNLVFINEKIQMPELENLNKELSALGRKINESLKQLDANSQSAKINLADIKNLEHKIEQASKDLGKIVPKNEAEVGNELKNDIKSTLLQVSNLAKNEGNEAVANQANRLLAQIEFNQLMSLANDSINTYLPLFWEDLNESRVIFKRGKKDKFYAQIKLHFAKLGELDILIALKQDKYLDINIMAEDKEFRKMIYENAHELKRALSKTGLLSSNFFVGDIIRSKLDLPSPQRNYEFQMGLDKKA